MDPSKGEEWPGKTKEVADSSSSLWLFGPLAKGVVLPDEQKASCRRTEVAGLGAGGTAVTSILKVGRQATGS